MEEQRTRQLRVTQSGEGQEEEGGGKLAKDGAFGSSRRCESM